MKPSIYSDYRRLSLKGSTVRRTNCPGVPKRSLHIDVYRFLGGHSSCIAGHNSLNSAVLLVRRRTLTHARCGDFGRKSKYQRHTPEFADA